MIVALLGEESDLKLHLRNHLVKKGFAECDPRQLESLERNHHYLLDTRLAPEELLNRKEVKSLLILVGKNESHHIKYDMVIFPEDPEEQVLEDLNRLILHHMRSQGRPDWDEYFMKIAQVAAMRSNCIKRKVGAVIVRDKRIVSTGYNGTPRGTRNCNEGGCPRCNSLASSGTRLDECLCSHAEENAITQSAYHGTSVKDATLYTTFSPCLMCCKMIINSGIIEVVFSVDYPLNDLSFRLFEEAGVRIRRLTL
jgi:dCMP deaminase